MSPLYASRARLELALAIGTLVAISLLVGLAPVIALGKDPGHRSDAGPDGPPAERAQANHAGPEPDAEPSASSPSGADSSPAPGATSSPDPGRSPHGRPAPEGPNALRLEGAFEAEASGTVSEAI